MTVSQEAREAAAKAICAANCKEWRTGKLTALGMQGVDADPLNNHWRMMADAALAAARPFIEAETLERAARIADQHAVAAFKAGSGPHPSAYAQMIAAAIRGEA